MPRSAKRASNASKKTSVSRNATNPAVARCSNAYQRAYAAAMKHTTNEYAGEVVAEKAFYAALPSPIGHEQVANFVACITFGISHDIIRQDKATRLLYAAQVALMSDRRKPGPHKSVAEEK